MYEHSRPIRRPKKSITEMQPSVGELPFVSIAVTTCSEPISVLKKTLDAALKVVYPESKFRVFVLDDGAEPNKRYLVESYQRSHVGISYVCRPKEHKLSQPAKGGNLNYLIDNFSVGDFLLVLDCDMICEGNILLQLLPYFFRWDQTRSRYVSNEVAWVQAPQAFYNVSPEDDLYGHHMRWMYGVTILSRDHFGTTPCLGTNVVFRVSALKDIGGFQTNSVAEDLCTAVKLQAQGWHSVYCYEVLAKGLTPTDLGSTIRQKGRWATGAFQVLFSDCPLFKTGLSWHHRVFYGNYIALFLQSVFIPFLLLQPILITLFRWSPLPNSSPVDLLRYYVPYHLGYWLFLTIAGSEIHAQDIFRYQQNLVALFPVYIKALVKVLAGVRCEFEVTPKKLTEERDEANDDKQVMDTRCDDKRASVRETETPNINTGDGDDGHNSGSGEASKAESDSTCVTSYLPLSSGGCKPCNSRSDGSSDGGGGSSEEEAEFECSCGATTTATIKKESDGAVQERIPRATKASNNYERSSLLSPSEKYKCNLQCSSDDNTNHETSAETTFLSRLVLVLPQFAVLSVYGICIVLQLGRAVLQDQHDNPFRTEDILSVIAMVYAIPHFWCLIVGVLGFSRAPKSLIPLPMHFCMPIFLVASLLLAMW
eukprot:CAMPEP_0184671106 /NCGR_PEP_ID=MMETSP0308-20130426/85298_1 /TAXON_ID=38269 /ORGANISM="Gloeochaete witrockiana, Strain SAG 46.84" /LENGTH=649 /DNA_ID=CAMNT_0027118161 /DNA_START=323 /DNA_END=2269 /DNA_ORIENTATION=+